MSTEIQLEVDVLWDELKDWEASVDAEWTEEYRVAYMTKKRDIVKDFFMNQVARWEKEQNAPAPAGGVDDDEEAIKRQLEEEDRLARQLLEEEYAAKAASDKAAADKAAADKAAADKAAAQKAAAEKAAAEKVAAEKAAAEAKARAEAEAKAKAAAAAAASSPRLGAESPTLARTNSSSASPALQRVEVDTSVALSDLEQDAALEKEFKEANLRITKNPGRQAADLTDTAVLATYIRLRNDRDTLNWMMLGYADDKSPNKITVVGMGDGGWNEMVANVPEDPIYLYLKHSFGDTGRAKFVFLTYVPDSLAGMKKSRVIGHRPAVEKLLKYMQITWHVLEKSELQIETLTSKLLAAGGANYSVQEQDKGDFSSYKKTTANFYAATEKRGNLGQVVYQTGPLTTTPMDISGRTMVASQADFRNNIVDLK